MKIILLLFAIGGALAAQTQSFAGRITDTMCGAHHGMAKDQPDDACVRTCVQGTSSQYALFDGQTVMRLSDQKNAAKFAGRPVKVVGTYNGKTRAIKVTSIESAN
jgi:hypothetical protein